jgi:hypothetical protein
VNAGKRLEAVPSTTLHPRIEAYLFQISLVPSGRFAHDTLNGKVSAALQRYALQRRHFAPPSRDLEVQHSRVSDANSFEWSRIKYESHRNWRLRRSRAEIENQRQIGASPKLSALTAPFDDPSAINMAPQPVECQTGDLFECSRLFEKVSGARHNRDFLFTAHLRESFLVQFDHLFIRASNDE